MTYPCPVAECPRRIQKNFLVCRAKCATLAQELDEWKVCAMNRAILMEGYQARCATLEQEGRNAIPGHVIHIPPGVLSREHLPDLVWCIEEQVGTSVQVTTLYPRTPPWLFAKLNREFGFTVDVCASDWNAKCKKYWTKEQDGQQQDWSNEICWLNPPYGQDLGDWTHKAYSESLKGATVVCLVPVAPDQSWWHTYAIKGELRWIRQTTAVPFPRCIVIFRPPEKVEEEEQ